jgi:hypothetical protein
MSRYQEVHDNDGIILWLCFFQNSAGTMIKNLIEASSYLSESKLQLSNFQGNVLQFTNAVHAPVCHLPKANEAPSFPISMFSRCYGRT